MSVNKVILMGYVGADPIVRYPEKDQPIAAVTLATNEKQGQSQQETTEWHRLVMYGPLAKVAENYIRKGTHLYVEGKLRTREYEDRMKISRKITEIIVTNVELLGRSPQQ